MIVLIKGGLCSEIRVDFFSYFWLTVRETQKVGLRRLPVKFASRIRKTRLSSTKWLAGWFDPLDAEWSKLYVCQFHDRSVCCSLRRVFGNLAGIVHVWQEVSCNSGGHYTTRRIVKHSVQSEQGHNIVVRTNSSLSVLIFYFSHNVND